MDINHLQILVATPDTDIRKTFFSTEAAQAVQRLGNVHWNSAGTAYTAGQLAQRLEGVDVCFTGWDTHPLDELVLQKADQLKIVAHTGGSVANIVTPALYERGVRVISGNEVYALSVAEGTIAYILLALRRLPFYMEMLKTSGWHNQIWYNEGLLNQTIGIIGFGAIARHLVRLLKPFDVRIKVSSSYLTQQQAAALGVEKADLQEILKTCKIVSLHSASTPQNRHMIGRAQLDMMQDGALFVNTARGSIVDEQALADVLKTGRITAVLDVFEQEPLPMDSPLRGLDHALLIPHMAGPTIDRRPIVVQQLVQNIQSHFSGGDMPLEISAQRALTMSKA